MKPVWIIDADGIENFDESISNVYYSTKVRAFLDEDKKLGVVATKGFGKTFLLKVKRNNMQYIKKAQCIPKDSMLDALISPRFNKSNIKFFENYSNWVLLWECSIAASIINSIEKIDINEYADVLGDKVIKLLQIGYKCPSEYFSYLLGLDRKNINLIFDKTSEIVNVLRDIRQSVCVFIDKIDQALSNQTEKIVGQSKMSTGPRNASFWQFAQLSLLETAYIFISINAHIKIYFSMRKEALLDYDRICSVNQNLREYFIELEYDNVDLENMFSQYIGCEKDENLFYPQQKLINPSLAFVGLDYIKSKYVRNKKEKFFDYIFRHTFLRPRDIMDICYQLSISNLKNQDDLENKIREIVNKESKIILESFLSETDNFLLSVSRDHIEEVCQLLNYNIITLNYARYICKRLNEIACFDELNEKYYSFNCDKNCEACNSLHPFCSLYNIGLIGQLWESRTNTHRIHFNSINESSISNPIHCLPASNLYFLHPCFASKAEHIRKNNNKDFDFNRSIIVGNNTEIKNNSIANIIKSVDCKLKNIRDERIFISSTCYDLHNERVMVDEVLTEIGFDVVRSDGDKFNSTLNGAHSHDHCIDEMRKCKYVIFIISSRYGGVYSGEKYKDEEKKIGEINQKLSAPSISLMEYFVARKYGIETHVFVDSKIYNERLSYRNNMKYNGNYIPSFADKNEVFEIIDFVTKQEKNNWLREYNDLQNLGELIRIVFEDK